MRLVISTRVRAAPTWRAASFANCLMVANRRPHARKALALANLMRPVPRSRIIEPREQRVIRCVDGQQVVERQDSDRQDDRDHEVFEVLEGGEVVESGRDADNKVDEQTEPEDCQHRIPQPLDRTKLCLATSNAGQRAEEGQRWKEQQFDEKVEGVEVRDEL